MPKRFKREPESDSSDSDTDTDDSRPQKVVKKCCHSSTTSDSPWPRNRALMMASQSNLADEIVTIKVGSGNEQTTFQWLKSILEYHSPFFVGALERSFKEAETREIELPEDDVDVFAEFLGWTTDHDSSSFGRDIDNPNLETTSDYFDLLARLYIFADKYNMPRLQNVVIDSIIDTLAKQDVFPSSNTVNHIYKQVAEDRPSPLCWLLTRFVVLSCPDIEGLFRSSSDKGNPYCQRFTQMVLCNYLGSFKAKHRTLKSPSSWLKVHRYVYHVREVELKTEVS